MKKERKCVWGYAKQVSEAGAMESIDATTIGNLIYAHYEHDEEKFNAYVKFIIEAYEEQGEPRNANIIRERVDGSYKK